MVRVIRYIQESRLEELFRILSRRGPLYLPLAEGPSLSFRPWSEGAPVDLKTVNSTVSAKEIFLPREEAYFCYRRAGRELALEPLEQEAANAVAFGLRACDLRGLEMLDRVFKDQDPPDGLYLRRREQTAIVALACAEPAPYCFCSLFGIDPARAGGADLQAWWHGEGLCLKALTAAGEELLSSAGELLHEGPAGAEEPPRVETGNFGLKLEGLPAGLRERFDDPVWEELYRSCLGCGACTYICPTCYCFDLEDFGHQEKGERYRCWDSCMFREFTLMAGGHNPRPTRKERVRNRFLHKLQYYPERYGEIACTGCGRCLRSCPVDLNIVQVIRALGGESR
ncbi:MAG TPA: 4Fe-4S dicluster domain-containing protein [Bacillota bacterium]|nr:4Fe-4S dicluster domain-containing protein [Bacillota bacterium]HPZ64276.1 4Fe-4S dicluster domain-containing protein [Bacillota bacterium]